MRAATSPSDAKLLLLHPRRNHAKTGAARQTPPRSLRRREAAAGRLLPLPFVRLSIIAAAALAASVAGSARADTGAGTPASQLVGTPQASVLGLRRNVGLRGVSLRQPITTQSALALSASTGTRKELPEVRVILGVQYLF